MRFTIHAEETAVNYVLDDKQALRRQCVADIRPARCLAGPRGTVDYDELAVLDDLARDKRVEQRQGRRRRRRS